MIALLRQTLFLAIAATVSWWVFLYDASSTPARTAPSVIPTPSVSVIPIPSPLPEPEPEPVAQTAPAPVPVTDPEPEPAPAATVEAAAPIEPTEIVEELATAPPPPERGVPDPPSEESAQAIADEAPPSEPERASVEALMRDSELVETARRELSGESRTGFATVLLATPEDQLAIARYFGEELLLVPRKALAPGPEGARWFRIDLENAAAPVRSVSGPPPLEGFRQYRDLFEYEYARLPEPLRQLRQSVLSRPEVYLFAALIPPAEWAAVVGRRREALARSGRAADNVSRYVLRYVRGAERAFDFAVQEIVFSDGERFLPETRLTDPRKGG